MEAKIDYKRCGFNLPADLVDKLDSFAEHMRVNRTVALTIIIQQYFDGQDALKNLNNWYQLLNDPTGLVQLHQQISSPISNPLLIADPLLMSGKSGHDSGKSDG